MQHALADYSSPLGRQNGGQAQEAPSKQVRVLLADDEAPIRQLMSRILVAQGWEVRAAADGQEAVEAWPEGGTPYDLVILDLRMPRLNGYEAYCRLRQLHPTACFLFVSGYAEEEIWKRVQEEGLPYLLKPFTPQELLRKVRELLNGAVSRADCK